MRVTLESRRAKARTRVAACCGSLALVLFAAAGPISAQEAGATVEGVAAAPDSGESEDQKLAKQLANPVASLISVPFQFNYDQGLNRSIPAGGSPSTSSRSFPSRSMRTGT